MMFSQNNLEYDFVEFFGVLPREDEYSGYIYYKVKKNGLILSFVIPHEDNRAEFFLQQETSETLLLSVGCYVSGGIYYRKDKNFEVLEFERCILLSAGSPIVERNEVFDDLKFPNKVDIELIVNPEISLRFF